MAIRLTSANISSHIPSGEQVIARFDSLFLKTANALHRLPDSPQKNALIGFATQKFRELDNILSCCIGVPLHRYCGCEVQEKGSNRSQQLKACWPTLSGRSVKWIPYPTSLVSQSPLSGLSSAIYSWSFGCGHNVVQEALSERLANQGMHVYKVAADKEVLSQFDIVHKWTRGAYSSGDIINRLIRHQYWRILQFLNWMFDAEKPEMQTEKIAAFRQSLIKRGNPDIAITCFDRYVGAIEKAAAQEKIPTLSVAADFAPKLSDIQSQSDVHNPHFIRSVMFQNDALIETLRTALKPEQIRFGGLPVRTSFLKKYTSSTQVATPK